MCLLATFFIEMSPHFWLSYLYILEINSLSIALFANIFSPCVAFFYLLIVSFAVQKLLSLIGSHLFIFAFISIALGEWPKQTFILLISENILSILSFRSFMVPCHIFKSLSHFEFTLFQDSTYVLIYDINFSLSDLLPSVWQTMSPTSVQVAQFHSFLWLSKQLMKPSKKQPHQKMDRKTVSIFLQRHTDGQEAYEKEAQHY